MSRSGLDRLLVGDFPRLGRIGWLTNGSAVTGDRLIWGPRAALARGLSVVQLFGPEHGPHGAVKEGTRIPDAGDPVTGLPVASLYADGPGGIEEALLRCDTVVVDLVDIGARYSTYLATATDLLDAAAGAGVDVVVLDRPNPLGRRREGPGLHSPTRSLVGRLDLPIRHGLTLGEIVLRYARTSGCPGQVEVIRFDGSQPAEPSFPGVYLPPSPNLNGPAAQLLYPGTCLVEGTTLSEGRGTANPFQVVGSPALDPEAVIDRLDATDHPGVALRAVRFVPVAGKHAGQPCAGLFLHVTDPSELRPVALGVGLLQAIFSVSGQGDLVRGGPADRRFLDLLWGSKELAENLTAWAAGGRPELAVGVDEGVEASLADDLLYES